MNQARIALSIAGLLLLGGCGAPEATDLPVGEHVASTRDALVTVESQNFQTFTLGESWAEGSTHQDLDVVFLSQGLAKIVKDRTKALYLEPRFVAGATRAALVINTTAYADAYTMQVDAKTSRQLRRTPNAWERDWLFWDYTDNNHFYYAICKSNGFEIGKEWQDQDGIQQQQFLYTAASPGCTVGSWHTYGVVQTVADTSVTFSVYLNGALVTTYTDEGLSISGAAYPGGKFGFYTEDARTVWDNFSVSR